MSTLLRELSEDVLSAPDLHVAALVEVSLLTPAAQQQLRQDQRLIRLPLLAQPEFDNLRDVGPALLTTAGDALDNLQSLLDRQTALQPAQVGWLCSAVPISELAHHLARANVMRGPDGARYLLRYHSPHVLAALHRRRDPWAAAFFAPLTSWWALQSGGRWLKYAGHARRMLPTLEPLPPNEPMWQALHGGNSEPHAVLARLQRLQPPLFTQACPGVRLGQVEALLAEADQLQIKGAVSRQDYVLLRLQRGDAMRNDPRWAQALKHHQERGLRLLDAWPAPQTTGRG